jgi:uracil-DNA glycosylase family 4
MTDTVKCHPAPPRNPGANRSPRPAEIHACAPLLHRELTILRPRVIVTFGKLAADNVAGAIAAYAGCHGANRWMPKLISFPHPSPRNQRTILKSYRSLQHFERAISHAFRQLISRLESPKSAMHCDE